MTPPIPNLPTQPHASLQQFARAYYRLAPVYQWLLRNAPKYLSDADLAQQIADYSQHDNLKPDSHYQFDKLLHNDYRLNLSLPALQDAVIFIALRQPEPTIKGITKLSGGGNGDSFRAHFVCATATSLT